MSQAVCWLVACAFVVGAEARAAGVVAAEALREKTGAHSRFLWTVPLKGQTIMQLEEGLELWVLDSDDGQGARKIGESGSYQRPLFTADGKRVVWTDYPGRAVYVVNFDGSGRRMVTPGQMGDVWRDPETGVDWVYVRELIEGEPERAGHLYSNGKMWRVQLDDPEVRELVWDKTSICHGSLFYLSLTQDGRYAASAFPWAGNGVAEFPNGSHQKWHFGCWSGLSPDNSGRFFSFDGDHRYIHMFDWGGVNRREIRLDDMPEFNRGEVYYPRWTNHPDFLVVSHGPRTYLAKFNKDFTAVESYLKVVDESAQLKSNDFLGYPDCWIDLGPDFQVADTSTLKPLDAVAEFEGAWPGKDPDLVFAWENRRAQNQVELADGTRLPIELEESGMARYGRDWQMLLHDGQFQPNTDRPARHLVERIKASKGMTLEMLVEPGVARQDGTLMVLETLDGTPNLRVLQWLNRINLELPRTVTKGKGNEPDAPRTVFSTILRGRGPAHIVFAYEDGRVDAYLDGELVDSAFMGGFNKWTRDDFGEWADEVRLIFGRRGDGQDPWRGQIEAVSIHARALTPAEVRGRYQQIAPMLENREKPAASTVTARLVHRSAVPTEKDMGIYSRALVANEYEIVRVHEGEPLNGKVVVQQFAVADRKPLPVVSEWENGREFRMVLQPLASHPELEGERLFDDIENFEAPVFLDVSTW